MTAPRSVDRRASMRPRRFTWMQTALVVALLTLGVWLKYREQQVPGPAAAPLPRPVEKNSADTQPRVEKKNPDDATLIASVTLRDEQNNVIYRGAVDLGPTLHRIERSERLQRFPHDGSVFGNRERRLPAKPQGYYREWVQPTPGESGPGPQRIVTGADGDAWYTPDHYRSFRRIR